MAINYAQTLSFTLAGSGAASGDTSIILKSFSDIDGNVLTMTDFGTKGFGTLEPGVQSQEEQIVFTGVTANVNGTYTLTGVSHVSSKTPYTETSGLNLAHNGSTEFVVSNTAKFYDTFTNKNNDETVTGSWSFPTPTVNANPATKAYVDAQSIAGAPDATNTTKGLVKLSSAVGTSMGTVTITIATPAEVTFASHGLVAGNTVQFTTTGTLPTGISVGIPYYVISTGLTTNEFQISTTLNGTAVDTTGAQSGVHTLVSTTPTALSENDTRVPTQSENDALVGTSGTPSSTNKYVTNDDTAENTASKVVRRKADSNVTVPTTPTATTDAASKIYVDTATIPQYSSTLIPSFTATTNLIGSTTHFTISIPAMSANSFLKISIPVTGYTNAISSLSGTLTYGGQTIGSISYFSNTNVSTNGVMQAFIRNNNSLTSQTSLVSFSLGIVGTSNTAVSPGFSGSSNTTVSSGVAQNLMFTTTCSFATGGNLEFSTGLLEIFNKA